MMRWLAPTFYLWLVLSGPTLGAEHRVSASPGALEALFVSGKVAGGDQIFLDSGKYGAVTLNALDFSPSVTIAAGTGARPVFDQLRLNNSSGLRFTGITVLPERAVASDGPLIEVRAGQNIKFDRLRLASAQDSTGWRAEDWVQRARGGIFLSGEQITVENSLIRVVRHGIASRANGAEIRGNVIEDFSGDGIRALGDNSQYTGNTIQGCVDVDDNHDDGIQSWSTDAGGQVGKGVVRNVLISENTIHNTNIPMACSLQGIGMFDGFFEGWMIQNNTIIVNHWHGITVMGGRDITIAGNTVVDARPDRKGPPWITITNHKDGRPSLNGLISGNTMQVRPGGGNRRFQPSNPGVTIAANRIVSTPSAAFSE